MTKRVAWHSVNDRNLKFTDREPLWEGIETVLLALGKSILNIGRRRGGSQAQSLREAPLPAS